MYVSRQIFAGHVRMYVYFIYFDCIFVVRVCSLFGFGIFFVRKMIKKFIKQTIRSFRVNRIRAIITCAFKLKKHHY